MAGRTTALITEKSKSSRWRKMTAKDWTASIGTLHRMDFSLKRKSVLQRINNMSCHGILGIVMKYYLLARSIKFNWNGSNMDCVFFVVCVCCCSNVQSVAM